MAISLDLDLDLVINSLSWKLEGMLSWCSFVIMHSIVMALFISGRDCDQLGAALKSASR